MSLTRSEVGALTARYQQENPTLLEQHPEFAAWLEEEYCPLAGGWQY